MSFTMRGLSLVKPACNYIPRNNIIKSFSSIENKSIGVIATKQSKPLLIGKVRTTTQGGSRVSRALRSEGLIPGVLYGVDDDRNVVKTMCAVDKNIINKALREKGRSFENTLFELQLDDKTSHLVTPRQLQISPITDEPISVNFLKYKPGNRMRIPIEYINTELNVELKRGSFLSKVNKYVECVCGNEIPSVIQVDLSFAQKGAVLRLNDLILPPNCHPASTVPEDFVVGIIRTGRGK